MTARAFVLTFMLKRKIPIVLSTWKFKSLTPIISPKERATTSRSLTQTNSNAVSITAASANLSSFLSVPSTYSSNVRHLYTFHKRCDQDISLALNDGTIKIFLSTKGTLGDVSPDIKSFLDYVDSGIVSVAFVKELGVVGKFK